MIHVKLPGHVHPLGPGVDREELVLPIVLQLVPDNAGLRLRKLRGPRIRILSLVGVLLRLPLLLPVAVQIHAPAVHAPAVVALLYPGPRPGVLIRDDQELLKLKGAFLITLTPGAQGGDKSQLTLLTYQLPLMLSKKHEKLDLFLLIWSGLLPFYLYDIQEEVALVVLSFFAFFSI